MKIKIKVWAISPKKPDGGEQICYGTDCSFVMDAAHGKEAFLAVFRTRKLARLTHKLHSGFYKNCKVIPITISY